MKQEYEDAAQQKGLLIQNATQLQMHEEMFCLRLKQKTRYEEISNKHIND